jgi:hypothetical protein
VSRLRFAPGICEGGEDLAGGLGPGEPVAGSRSRCLFIVDFGLEGGHAGVDAAADECVGDEAEARGTVRPG